MMRVERTIAIDFAVANSFTRGNAEISSLW
jgi:hypothetical protein